MSSLLLSNVLRYHRGEQQEKVEEEGKAVGKSNGFRLGSREEAEASSDSSSIGAASTLSSDRNGSDHGGEEEEEEEEVESKRKDGALGSLDSLEDSLPIKRGLSNFFSGKSKSFASLSDVVNASTNDIVKPENPFNKRRRVLMMSKMRRASCSSLVCPPLPPLSAPAHTVAEAEEDEEEEEDEEKEKHGGRSPPSMGPFPRHGNSSSMRRNKAFRSPRSFSLSDLQHV
ncbi:protein OXIDATIVE STRESS 3 LIKE 4-like [Musa acuminata AAA Group]|uniref:protein OXIDATIVE STRESS 3 LIKE 4-like n=1 Tax=Musa acuminata AAA Group TaxID=214697 RepID=UPI0031D07985